MPWPIRSAPNSRIASTPSGAVDSPARGTDRSPADRARAKWGANCARGTRSPVRRDRTRPAPRGRAPRHTSRSPPRPGCRTRHVADPPHDDAVVVLRRCARPRWRGCRPRSVCRAMTGVGVMVMAYRARCGMTLMGDRLMSSRGAQQVDDREIDLDEVPEIGEREELAAGPGRGHRRRPCPRREFRDRLRPCRPDMMDVQLGDLGGPAMKRARAAGTRSRPPSMPGPPTPVASTPDLSRSAPGDGRASRRSLPVAPRFTRAPVRHALARGWPRHRPVRQMTHDPLVALIFTLGRVPILDAESGGATARAWQAWRARGIRPRGGTRGAESP